MCVRACVHVCEDSCVLLVAPVVGAFVGALTANVYPFPLGSIVEHASGHATLAGTCTVRVARHVDTRACELRAAQLPTGTEYIQGRRDSREAER